MLQITVCLLNRMYYLSVESRRTMTSEVPEDALSEMIRSFVPPLSHQLYKGQCGRIAVIGGCRE